MKPLAIKKVFNYAGKKFESSCVNLSMKFLKKIIPVFAIVLSMYACRSTPNHMHEPVNSTESGSNAAGNNDSGSNRFDTLSPSQPNGMDTTGEQTGRMNNTPGNNNRSNAQNLDTGIHKSVKK